MLEASDSVLEAGLGLHFPANREFGDSAEQRKQASIHHVQQRCFAGHMAVSELCTWLYSRSAWHQYAPPGKQADLITAADGAQLKALRCLLLRQQAGAADLQPAAGSSGSGGDSGVGSSGGIDLSVMVQAMSAYWSCVAEGSAAASALLGGALAAALKRQMQAIMALQAQQQQEEAESPLVDTFLEQAQGLATSACALMAAGIRQEWSESRLQHLLAFPAGEPPALSAVQHLEAAVFAAMHGVGELKSCGPALH